MTHYMTLPTAQTNDDIKLSLENMLPTDIPQLEQNLMSLPELTPEKVIKLQKNVMFCKNIVQDIGYSKYVSNAEIRAHVNRVKSIP